MNPSDTISATDFLAQHMTGNYIIAFVMVILVGFAIYTVKNQTSLVKYLQNESAKANDKLVEALHTSKNDVIELHKKTAEVVVKNTVATEANIQVMNRVAVLLPRLEMREDR